MRRLRLLLELSPFVWFVVRLWITFLLVAALARHGFPGLGVVVCIVWFLLEITRDGR